MKKGSMTARNKIRREILLSAKDEPGLSLGPLDTDEQVDEAYDQLDAVQDYEGDFRHGQCETNLDCPTSRYYESKSVAAKLSDGTWVGWTYWYGGGKYGDPEAVDWMEDAYNLTCVEEEKVIVVKTFTVVGDLKEEPL